MRNSRNPSIQLLCYRAMFAVLTPRVSLFLMSLASLHGFRYAIFGLVCFAIFNADCGDAGVTDFSFSSTQISCSLLLFPHGDGHIPQSKFGIAYSQDMGFIRVVNGDVCASPVRIIV